METAVTNYFDSYNRKNLFTLMIIYATINHAVCFNNHDDRIQCHSDHNNRNRTSSNKTKYPMNQSKTKN